MKYPRHLHSWAIREAIKRSVDEIYDVGYKVTHYEETDGNVLLHHQWVEYWVIPDYLRRYDQLQPETHCHECGAHVQVSSTAVLNIFNFNVENIFADKIFKHVDESCKFCIIDWIFIDVGLCFDPPRFLEIETRKYN